MISTNCVQCINQIFTQETDSGTHTGPLGLVFSLDRLHQDVISWFPPARTGFCHFACDLPQTIILKMNITAEVNLQHFVNVLWFHLATILRQHLNRTHSAAGLYKGCRQTGQVRIPFCIMAIAHSRCTLCEHGKIWHPLNASSRQMQHSSWPESGLHLCFPWSRLSRQTLHTSQWNDLSLCILHIPHLSQW